MKVLGANLDLVNKQVKNLADGSAATDAVTLQQVQALVRGLSWKAAVRAASTANVTISSPGTSLDGVTLAANDRVLLKNQTTGAENGIYVWTASGSALTRALDADSSAELVGAAVYVTEGTTNADKAYTQTVDPFTLGSTTPTFSQFGGGTSYTAGNGLSLTGSAFAVVAGAGIIADGSSTRVDTAVVVRKFAATIGNGALTTITSAHGLGTADIMVQVRDTTSGEVVYPDITVDATNITTTWAVAPTTNQYRIVGQA